MSSLNIHINSIQTDSWLAEINTVHCCALTKGLLITPTIIPTLSGFC